MPRGALVETWVYVFVCSLLLLEGTFERTFVFVHIPKCGGTSFLNRACDVVNSQTKEKFSFFPPACHVKKPPFSWNLPGCPRIPPYGGTHCSYSEISDCLSRIAPGEDAQKSRLFLTILRPPAARVFSEYNWWKNSCSKKQTWPRELCSLVAKSLPQKLSQKNEHTLFLEWLRYPANPAHNRVAKSLAFFPSLHAPHQGDCLTFDYKAQYVFWDKIARIHGYNATSSKVTRNHVNPPEETNGFAIGNYFHIESFLNADDKVLARVKGTLEKRFFFVGLTDRFEESVRLFARAVGNLTGSPVLVPPPVDKGRERHASKASFSLRNYPDVVREVVERNRHDQRVYEHVVGWMEERKREGW